MPTVDSKLASEFIESPNHRNGRLYPITRITIHHAVMVCNARVVANVFKPSSRKASATYCVGNDGSIVQCVKESDMPWTSSSSDNDNRAITLEVANESTQYPYPISDKALAAVIELCADICRRNPGIGKLNYTGDTTGNLTMHKWFANTQCPGPYLAGKFPYIAEEVNKRLGAAPATSAQKETYTLKASGLKQADMNSVVSMIKAKGCTATVSERTIADPVATKYTSIMGNAVATSQQMVAYIKKVNPNVAQSVINMIPYYISEGKAEGVRGDVAFAQSCVETGNFTFPSNTCTVTLGQNNFAMMGVTSAYSKGESFATPQLGIRAQIQHLKAYASAEALKGSCVDPRFNLVQRGSAQYVEWLGTQENPNGKGWAGSKGYGNKILTVLNAVKDTKAEAATIPVVSNTLKVGDMVTIQKNAPVYGTTKSFSSWVYNKKLYVRAIKDNCITVSIYSSGAITGQVDKKYLTKV